MPDWRTLKMWYFTKRRDNRDDTVLLAVIDEFARDGLTFDSALNLCPELLVNAGQLTKRKPTAAEQADIDLGWEVAKRMGELDIGQSVAVKERAVLAVEAIEGTDRAIQRAGEFCRAVFHAEFGEGRRIDEPAIMAEIVASLNLDAASVLAVAQSEFVKMRLRRQTEEAQRLGVFGAPTFIAFDGELFWGNDRLERALVWANDGR